MDDNSESERESMADELVAIRCQLGEAAAFDALIERWHLPLWKYLRRVGGSDESAADALQDVWLRVVRSIPALREPARLRAWLFGIARRVAMDRLRQRYAEPAPESLEFAELASEEPAEDRQEDLELMHKELAAMPPLEREVLVLFYLNELSLSQLAEVLAIPVGTAKSRLFRARQMLRRQLTDKGVQP